jgi:hypothetical protein
VFYNPRVRAAAACVVAIALWVAAGTMAFTSAGGPRLALLPSVWSLAVCLGLALVGLVVYRRPVAPWITAAILLLLPWLPLPVPPVFLLWTRPLIWLFGTGFLVGYVVRRLCLHPAIAHVARDPRRAPLLIAVLSVVLYGAAAWRVDPFIPAGDEPHYLVITQSLLYDFDLRIENNHTRGDYRAYHPADLPPHYIVRGLDGEIYSIHMPGVSALVAPAFLLFGYAGAVATVVVMAAATGALLWHLAFAVTRDVGAAWFGWAAAGLSVPFVFHSFTLYPDSVGMLFVLTGCSAVVYASRGSATPSNLAWCALGIAPALLPWLHSRFALLAAVFGLIVPVQLVRVRRAMPAAAAYLLVPAVAAMAWLWFYDATYGAPDPRAQYGPFLASISSPSFISSGIGGLLFDSQFGLLPYAPVLIAASFGLVSMLRSPATEDAAGRRSLGITILLLVVPYLISTTTMRMWWGGWSAPARFLVPLVPGLGIAAAVGWSRAGGEATRMFLRGALWLTIAVSGALVWVDRGRLAYNVRQQDPLWLEWAAPLVELARGLPTFLRTEERVAWAQVAVWMAAMVSAWLLVRGYERRSASRRLLAPAAAAAASVAGMLAVSGVWRLNGVDTAHPARAQLRLLDAAGSGGFGVSFDPPGILRIPDLVRRMTLSIPVNASPGSEDEQDAAILSGPVAAGVYALSVGPNGMPGRLTVGIGREHFPLQELNVTRDGVTELRVPVDVRGLVVRADPDAAAALREVTLRPQQLVSDRDRLAGGVAWQAIRSGPATLFFLDSNSFPEPGGFWLGGARESVVVIQPDDPRFEVVVAVRNAPVANSIGLERRGWRDEFRMSPSEERLIAVPLDPRRRGVALRLRASTGFKPSEVERGSTDERFLGAWVAVSR